MADSSTHPLDDLLNALKKGTNWREIFPLALAIEKQADPDQSNDETLIQVYKECLVRGVTYQKAPDEFLEICKRLSKLLFKYGRSNEANNFLLQLRDLSPDPKQVPSWAWSYSAKLAYLEDIEYCANKPEVVLDFLANATASDSKNRQALAVLTDFVNSATEYISNKPDAIAANSMSSALYDFLTRFPTFLTETLEESLEHLDDLVDTLSEISVPQELTEQPLPQSAESAILSLQDASAEYDVGEIDNLRVKNQKLEDQHLELQLQVQIQSQELQQQIDRNTDLQQIIDELQEKVAELPRTAEPLAEEVPIETTLEGQLGVEPTESIAGDVLPVRSRILIIGQSRVPDQQIFGICKRLGLDKNQIELKMTYDAFDTLAIESLRYNDSIAGILIGPVPHKVPGKDDPANALIEEIGFPPTIKIKTNTGQLKITKSSFREALKKLLTKITSVEPTVH